MGKTISVELYQRCNNCGNEFYSIQWYPDDHFRELANSEQMPCPYCNEADETGILETLDYNQVEPKLKKHGKNVDLKIGKRTRNLLRLRDHGKLIEINLESLRQIPYFGDIQIRGKFGTPLEVFSFNGNDIIMRKEL